MAERGVSALITHKQPLISYATTGSMAGDKGPYPGYVTYTCLGRTGADQGDTVSHTLAAYSAILSARPDTSALSFDITAPQTVLATPDIVGAQQGVTSSVFWLVEEGISKPNLGDTVLPTLLSPIARQSDYDTPVYDSLAQTATARITNLVTAQYVSRDAITMSIGGVSTSVTTIFTGTITYFMRAYHNVLLRYVTWSVADAPDTTGVYSGYSPTDLRDIVVIRRYNYP